MKKSTVFISASIIFYLSLNCISCIKRPPDVTEIQPETQPQQTEIVEEKLEPEETLIKAKILSPKTFLCLIGRDQKMHQILNLTYGENISVIQMDKALVQFESENKTYIHSVYKEVEYWIDLDSIALECENALILEKAQLYADREFLLPTDERNSPFRFGDFVCRSTNTEDQGETFDRIYYYDKHSKKVKSAFIKKGTLSTVIDDLVVMDCVKQLRITKRATPRNEIFKRAAKYKPCQKIAMALEAEKTERIENNYQDVLNALPGAKYKVNVPELLTVDQSKDPFQ